MSKPSGVLFLQEQRDCNLSEMHLRYKVDVTSGFEVRQDTKLHIIPRSSCGKTEHLIRNFNKQTQSMNIFLANFQQEVLC